MIADGIRTTPAQLLSTTFDRDFFPRAYGSVGAPQRSGMSRFDSTVTLPPLPSGETEIDAVISAKRRLQSGRTSARKWSNFSYALSEYLPCVPELPVPVGISLKLLS